MDGDECGAGVRGTQSHSPLFKTPRPVFDLFDFVFCLIFFDKALLSTVGSIGGLFLLVKGCFGILTDNITCDIIRTMSKVDKLQERMRNNPQG